MFQFSVWSNDFVQSKDQEPNYWYNYFSQAPLIMFNCNYLQLITIRELLTCKDILIRWTISDCDSVLKPWHTFSSYFEVNGKQLPGSSAKKERATHLSEEDTDNPKYTRLSDNKQNWHRQLCSHVAIQPYKNTSFHVASVCFTVRYGPTDALRWNGILLLIKLVGVCIMWNITLSGILFCLIVWNITIVYCENISFQQTNIFCLDVS